MNEKYNFFLLKGFVSNINEVKEQKNHTKFRYFSLAQNYDKNEKHQVAYYNIKLYEKDFAKIENIKVGSYVIVMGYLKSYIEDKQVKEVKIAKDIVELSKDHTFSPEVQETLKELQDYKWFEDDSISLE